MRSSEIVYELRLQIKTGHLRPGDKLPTQRDMAWEFKCSLGTVTRAYAELERLGLTYGEVGRGTFVAEQSDLEQRLSPLSSFATDFGHGGVGVDLSLNQFYHAETDQAMSFAMRRIAKREPYADYSNYNDTRGRYQDLEVAQSWLEEILGGYWSLDKLMITQGGQGGLFLAMKALTSPGDTIATEAFGYPGIKAAALEANLKIQAVEMDDYGMRPESFAALCERHDIKLLVTNPTDHNPTGTTLPLERREEITVIARKHNVIIVEDAVYAPFQVEPSKSFVELAGDVSIYITSFSKVFSLLCVLAT
ncbi:PLP-dependent aminotransferase family protein [Sneathiella glossodoripedis]|uniref:aminotransferase-like domain-containing protein n=1 Tax=Sneathiella glossodoripedis TaxID=418853 RepID=UPI0009FC6A2E|nr:PLP-dependent aminotransferase family protein [Sneathiella glossodoripedis]